MFAVDVSAAIQGRLGLTSAARPSLVPLADAPLFGKLIRQASDSSTGVDNVLPPRRNADHLMDIYWRDIQPLEPLLEREGFSQSYQALFAGTLLADDERIVLSTLNTVFALATQSQDLMLHEQRENTSNTYFHRAWALLRPETIIWEAGSLELV
jgi:hypothetical protein